MAVTADFQILLHTLQVFGCIKKFLLFRGLRYVYQCCLIAWLHVHKRRFRERFLGCVYVYFHTHTLLCSNCRQLADDDLEHSKRYRNATLRTCLHDHRNCILSLTPFTDQNVGASCRRHTVARQLSNDFLCDTGSAAAQLRCAMRTANGCDQQ